MKLRNFGLVFVAATGLLAACGGDDDTAADGAGGGGTGGKGVAGAADKGGSAGTAGSAAMAGSAGNPDLESAGAGGESGGGEVVGTGGAGGEGGGAPVVAAFTVTLENVAPTKLFSSSGVFDTPVGALNAGAATPGKTYKFTVDAGRKQKLFFASMLAATNDLFLAPDGAGIPLYMDDGTPISADVTSQVYLWDAGTELNEEPFLGPNTVTKQASPNTGPDDTNNKVRKIADVTEGFVFSYPAVASMIKVTVTHTSGTMFDITLDDLTGSALTTSDAMSHPLPISPGVWVLSAAPNALFTPGMSAPAHGLESIAEDGKPAALGAYAAGSSGITYPASPGVWLLHKSGTMPLFTAGAKDYGKGIEAIAEDGNPTSLGANLAMLDGYVAGAIFNTPVDAAGPGPIVPGSKYSFTFDASPGDALSFASMLAATNDVFFAPQDSGIALFDEHEAPVTGDVSDQVYLWDAGTEGNEEPGIGPHTVTNQLAPNTGTPGEGKVQLLSAVTTDTYSYPSPQSVLKVTLSLK